MGLAFLAKWLEFVFIEGVAQLLGTEVLDDLESLLRLVFGIGSGSVDASED